MLSVADCAYVSYGAHGDIRLPTYHIPRAQPAHLWCGAPDQSHPPSDVRGVEDAAPYGGCVRIGISIKPSLSARRGWLVADVRRDQPHPRLIRRARLRPPPHVSYPAGVARAPLVRRARPASSLIRRKGRRGRRPLRRLRAGRYQHKAVVVRPPGLVGCGR